MLSEKANELSEKVAASFAASADLAELRAASDATSSATSAELAELRAALEASDAATRAAEARERETRDRATSQIKTATDAVEAAVRRVRRPRTGSHTTAFAW